MCRGRKDYQTIPTIANSTPKATCIDMESPNKTNPDIRITHSFPWPRTLYVTGEVFQSMRNSSGVYI